MINVEITKNEAEQRLDRFLKKYLENAPLSHIYKICRKDLKVNGKRGKEEQILHEGDVLSFYMSQEDYDKFTEKKKITRAKKQFTIAYEDDNILVVEKPFGLLTHGDLHEKKNTLSNQVVDYLVETGQYVPRLEKTFSPAAVNRLDRNTTGLVIFGKNAQSLKLLNQMIRERDNVNKFYMTIVKGQLKEPVHLMDKMEKNQSKNVVKVLPIDNQEGKIMETVARPLKCSARYSLVEVEIKTGRTHQIRAHLSQIGHPIIGDAKYGNPRTNKWISEKFGLNTQLLHAYKLQFSKCPKELKYLEGKEIISSVPENFQKIGEELFRD